ncbi:ZIP family metal transporter [Methanobacterium spitsbergense]|uniref:ZIP family zinc transporter n=1 Tax=Methanobacterium spitsbergense TaxID=2874285 RepID=A0A8T5V3N7_9EURY|nr:ZIP family metal transporter [Methanobacterium spitsbergense]MBZ2166275.1 ZIP family zinc transporter [Methanobacterium spitsbergense]
MFSTMFQAGLWGFVGGLALLIGAVAGYYIKIRKRIIGSIMAFGAGVLIAAACFELLEQAFEWGGYDSTILGFVAGVVIFTLVDLYLSRTGAKHRKTADKSVVGDYDENGPAIAAGALLDGIPESVAIGLTMISGGAVGIATVVAVFISNIPEGLSSSVGMKSMGWSKKTIFGLWFLIAIITGLSSLAGYSVFSQFPPDVNAATLALAAGALLTMIADTMIPEAFRDTHEFTGLMMAFGFLIAFVLSKLA